MKKISIFIVITIIVSMLGNCQVDAAATDTKTSYNISFGEQLTNEYGRALYSSFVEKFVCAQDKVGVDGQSLEGLPVPVEGNDVLEYDFPDFYMIASVATKDEASKLVSNWAKEKREILMEEVEAAVDAFIKDYPQVYWMSGATFKIVASSLTSKYADRVEVEATLKLKITPTLFFVGADTFISDLNQGILKAENEIINNYGINDLSNDVEKLRAIHDYICNRVKYNNDATSKNAEGYEYTHTILPVFMDNSEWGNSVVCEGYAKAFKVLADRFKVQTAIIVGTAINTEGKSESHMWNVAKVDGKWYGVDVTWDDHDTVKDTYFLVGQSTKGISGKSFKVERKAFDVFSESESSSKFVLPVIEDEGYFYKPEETTTTKQEDVEKETTRQEETTTTKPIETTVKELKIGIKYTSNYVYTGKPIKCKIVVTANGKKLIENKDYTVKCTNNIKVGKAKAVITFKGEYSNVKNYTLYYRISKINISNMIRCRNIKLIRLPRNKFAVQKATFKMKNKTLVIGRDITVKYKYQYKKKGIKIIIQGKGIYTGKKIFNVKIR